MKSTKHEARNPKQIQSSNDQNSKRFEFGILNLDIVSDFDIRISDFTCPPKPRRRRGFRYSCRSGQAMVIASLFFLIISMTITLGVVQPVTSQLSSSRSIEKGAQSMYIAEGVSADVTYRLLKGMPVDTIETIRFGEIQATATTTVVLGGREVESSGNSGEYVRKSKAHLSSGTGVAFNYGLQAGNGGIELTNSALIEGNVFANGPVTGANSNLVKGTAVSAGPAGLIDGVYATSSAYAHTIRNATIDGSDYYQSISNTTVLGTLYPGSTDQATTSLPISDALIASWEAAAASGGTYTGPCPYRVVGPETMGPRKIACNMYLDSSDDLTLRGPVWVVGDIYLNNNAIIRTDPSLAGQSVALIAHDTEDLDDHGRIEIANTAQIISGSPNSFVLLLSQNNAAEVGSSQIAIEAKNSVTGDVILYAKHGLISIANSISVKEVSAYKIKAQNNAKVIYKSGLANLLFTGGPGGGYIFDKWREVE